MWKTHKHLIVLSLSVVNVLAQTCQGLIPTGDPPNTDCTVYGQTDCGTYVAVRGGGVPGSDHFIDCIWNGVQCEEQSTTCIIPPPTPSPPASSSTGGMQDPHLRYAEGGHADFKGENGTVYNFLSAPRYSFALQTHDTTFLLPTPTLVFGSFFTNAFWVVRTVSGNLRRIHFQACTPGYVITNENADVLENSSGRVWKSYNEQDLSVYMKQATLVVRAAGWEVNTTRHPVYNFVSGPSKWRIDMTIRPLDDTGIIRNGVSKLNVQRPHGIVGQSYDGDGLAISGPLEVYNTTVVTTSYMANGTIEGDAHDYALSSPFSVNFTYSRFDYNLTSYFPKRNISALLQKGGQITESFLSYTGDFASRTHYEEPIVMSS